MTSEIQICNKLCNCLWATPICKQCDVSDVLLFVAALPVLPPLQLRGGARRRDGCGRWSPRRWSPCRRGRPRRSSARHCATVSFSAKCSTASIPAPSPRCVSDAHQIWGQNVTNFFFLLNGNWNTTAACQCFVLSSVGRLWRIPSSRFRHSMGLPSLQSSTSRT